MGNCIQNNVKQPQKAAQPSKLPRKSRPSKTPVGLTEPYPSIEDVLMQGNRRQK